MKVSIDTRTLEPGDIFIPVKGKNFDGHNFIEEAKKKGASQILDVDLGEFAQKYRQKFKIPVIAITGSTGKTTTKDMVASVLAQKFKVLKNEENFNNEIGLPLAILKLEKEHQALVVEMAMRRPGEIKYLAKIAKPQIGLITNIGLAHVELLKTRENISRAKSELLEVLAENFRPSGGLKKPVIILNSDDDFFKTLAKKAQKLKLTVKTFGLKGKPDCSAGKIVHSLKGVDFVLKMAGEEIEAHLGQPGRHNVYNALAAACAGLALGVSFKKIKKGLEEFRPSSQRMEIFETEKYRIINDTYNANPDSVRAALEILKNQTDFLGRPKPRKIAVLADMLELGKFSRAAHRQVGEFLAESGINILVAIGENSFYTTQGSLNAGLAAKNIYHFRNNQEAIEPLKKILVRGDVILVKGSRAMKMEEIVGTLK